MSEDFPIEVYLCRDGMWHRERGVGPQGVDRAYVRADIAEEMALALEKARTHIGLWRDPDVDGREVDEAIDEALAAYAGADDDG